MMRGFILESKKILESEIWKKPPLYFKVWHYLLLNANYKDTENLKRGQLFTSINTIRESCSYYVGYRKEMPSRKEVYRILDWLRCPCEGDNEGDAMGAMIETTKVTHGLVVSIVNYNLYQDFKSYEGNNEGNDEKDANGKRTGQKGNNNNKEYKRIKNNTLNNNGRASTALFKKPTVDEVREYCQERGNGIDAQSFIDFYEARGWKLSKGLSMKDWKAAVRTWERNNKSKTSKFNNHQQRDRNMSELEKILVGTN